MKTLFVLDNGQGYSANEVHFVVADPDVDGADIGERMVAALRREEWAPRRAKILLVAIEFQMRDESRCQTVAEFFRYVASL